ncbi:peptidylprolyl isomerase [Parvularcula bermudensis]|nr:peptidylprolyl isomerase [Parvularcula bermudensis]
MELPSGPMIIEMRPDLAPNHVARIQTLARRRFYDGAPFHRVIEGFMAQGGDPTGTGEGGSSLPDLQGEFAQPIEAVADKAIIGRDSRAAQIGFVGSVPVGTQPPTLPSLLVDDTVALWGLHCQGVMSMARTNDPNSANSQFFVMFGDNRDSLDQRYTVWGRVVDGYINARRINRGEPPTRPTPIVRARLMSDLPTDQRKTIEVLDPSTAVFKDYLRARGILSADGFVENACNVSVPVRINGEITS